MQCTKCVVVGDGYVGKTALVGVFSNKGYKEAYTPTIFDNSIIGVEYNNTLVNLGVFDTAGQEEYDKLRPMAYTDTDVFIICFSLVDHDSLDNILSKWKPEINKYSKDAKLLLVGTKLDLWRKDVHKHNAVPKHSIDQTAQKLGAEFIAVSALKNQGIEEVFQKVAELSLQASQSPGKKPKSDCVVM